MNRRVLPALTGLLIVLALLLGGCAHSPDYRDKAVNLPAAWPENGAMKDNAQVDGVAADWWKLFEDPDMDTLVEKALEGNTGIRLQAARVEEARARLGFAKAGQMPTVSFQADALRQRQSGAASGIPQASGSISNLFSLAGLLNYEVDIWGRLAKEREAAQALLEESQFAGEAVRLAVVSDVAVTVLNLKAARRELEITMENVSISQQTYDLELARYEAGQIDNFILSQARAQLDTAKALVPLKTRRVNVLEGVLGILLGLDPAEIFAERDPPSLTLGQIKNPGPLPLVLPVELLKRRPDIRAAEAALAASAASVGVARASRLPKLSLSALLGTSAIEVGDLFSSSAQSWNIGAQASGAILDFGRSRASVQSAQARYEQAGIAYEAAVNTAFNEVREALVLYKSAMDYEDAVSRQRESLRQTLDLARIRYDEGMTGFLDYLDAQRAFFAAEQALNSARLDRLVSAATLLKALGGGWEAASAPYDSGNGK
ncbi:MAG: TolC family protein [Desulfatibacillaceae bacterium]|nr:TolC family protein [Desulfatibacillaceae bacterium]